MSIRDDLKDLLEAEVISESIADKIQAYYDQRTTNSGSRLFIAFGIFGALLVGLGVILIVAHNWDELSLGAKTILAFIPLILAQLLAGYTLVRKREYVVWKEASSTMLVFCLGACMAMISQIYQISGSLDQFLLTWILLSIPIVYLMQSSMASLLCLVGITMYACDIAYWSHPPSENYFFWLLFASVVPYYISSWKKESGSNFVKFHHWVVPLAVVIVLGSVSYQAEELMFVAYMALFGLCYLIGHSRHLAQEAYINNGYLAIGFIGSVGILLALSFNWFWEDLRRQEPEWMNLLASREFFLSLALTVCAVGILFLLHRRGALERYKLLTYAFLVFPLIFVLGYTSDLAVLLINVLLLAIGVSTIRTGASYDHLGVLNLGMLVITALIICRFFDTNISFVVRGILFVSVGVGFFLANHFMLKRRS